MKTYGKFYNRIFALLVVTVLAAAVLSPQLAMPSYVNAQQTIAEIDEMIDGVLRWKKAKSGGDVTDNLLDSTVDFAGTSPADWYAVAVGRLGTADGQAN